MKKLKLLGLVGITLIALANAGWAAGHGGGGGAGPTRSEGVEKFIEDMAKTKNVTPNETEKEFFRTTRPSSLLQRFATTDEVAALVTFVASPLSSAINGAALRVEGGVLRSIF